jgi:hypothetical protein
MKKIFFLLLSISLFFSIGFAQDYIFFYGNWCAHCLKAKEFFQENNILEKFDIKEKEIYFNGDDAWQIELLYRGTQ